MKLNQTALTRDISGEIMKFLAVIAGKIIILLSRLFKAGGGSALPGLVALRIDPRLIAKITSKLKHGTIVITGTNGKTTTAKYAAEILRESGYKVVHNRTGSNLVRGIASALIEQSTIFGRTRGDIGLFEVDEATMPNAIPQLKPKIVLVTNLFRDQLDRYGELDTTARMIGSSIAPLQGAMVLLNADDPLVAWLARDVNERSRVAFFGLDEARYISTSRASMDSKDCIICGSELQFDRRFYGHLGLYSCPNCDFKRPPLDFEAHNIYLHGVKNSSVTLRGSDKSLDVALGLSGTYNVYNSLAAYALVSTLDVDERNISMALTNSDAAFGRMERFVVNGKETYLLLIKNPIGLTQIAETLSTDSEARNFMLVLNDNFADGTDISWIWDADISALPRHSNFIYTTGIRAGDMALRFKYEGFETGKIVLVETIDDAFEQALSRTGDGETLYVLATYTGMLHIRNYLTRKGFVEGFWKEVA
jgi:UDP-N-acetylmuramyl tripeptide synthase